MDVLRQTDCAYAVYTEAWFWAIALGILFIAIGFIVWDSFPVSVTPNWVWWVILVGVILLIIGILACVYDFYRGRNMAVEMYQIQ